MISKPNIAKWQKQAPWNEFAHRAGFNYQQNTC